MSDQRSGGKEFNPGDTQVIDLADVDLSALPEASEPAMSRRTAPPPLPPQVSLPPPERPISLPPPQPSFAPAPAPPRGRSTGFYVALLGAFLVLGIAGGAIVAFMKRPAPGPATPGGAGASAAPSGGGATPAVITIPTVDMADDDAGASP